MVVNALEVTVCFVIYFLTKVLVCFGPHLRKVGWEQKTITMNKTALIFTIINTKVSWFIYNTQVTLFVLFKVSSHTRKIK